MDQEKDSPIEAASEGRKSAARLRRGPFPGGSCCDTAPAGWPAPRCGGPLVYYFSTRVAGRHGLRKSSTATPPADASGGSGRNAAGSRRPATT